MQNNITPGPEITPKMKVGELLEAYPHLLDVLLSLSPAFAKLKNPVLMLTIGRVSTLQQVAVVGGTDLKKLINRLRSEVGQALTFYGSVENTVEPPENWFDTHHITSVFSATSVLNRGESPMAEILRLVRRLNKGEVLAVESPFVPAPIIEALKKDGYTVFVQQQETVTTYITP